MAGFPRDPTEMQLGTFDVNGTEATVALLPDGSTMRVEWTVSGRSYVIRTAGTCDGETSLDVDALLRFARELG